MKKLEHIAFIMDGNRRWADGNGVPRVRGHREGIFAIERVIDGCLNEAITYATFYAFSTENWRRTLPELRYLSRLLFRYLTMLIEEKAAVGILDRVRVQFVGNISSFGPRNTDLMRRIEARTLSSTGLRVILAVSYGGRDEIVDSVNLLVSKGVKSVSAKDIEDHLYAPDVPAPDLMVRTGETYRLSNFLTWQSVYSELLFVKKFWPDIRAEDITEYKRIYEGRERKFGA